MDISAAQGEEGSKGETGERLRPLTPSPSAGELPWTGLLR
jgi:hypothetical protein